jgi:hypothetical protein
VTPHCPRWLDTWTGLGLINQVVAPKGFGVAPTPWRAVQIAAWDRGVGGGEDSRRAKWLSHS